MDEYKELLPCPFCGNEPILKRGSWGIYSIGCEECGIGMTKGHIGQVKKSWNRRYIKENKND